MSTQTPLFNLPPLLPHPRPPSHSHLCAAGPLAAQLHSMVQWRQAGTGEHQGLRCPSTGSLYRGREGLCHSPTSTTTTAKPHSSCHGNNNHNNIIISGAGCFSSAGKSFEKNSIPESRGRAEALLQRLPVAGHRHHDSGPDGVEAPAWTAAHTQGEEKGKGNQSHG